MNKKNTRIVGIVIVFISFILFISSISSLLLNDNDNNKPEEKPVDNKEDKSDSFSNLKEIPDDDLELLMNQVKIYNKELSKLYPINDVAKLSNQDLLRFSYLHIKFSDLITFSKDQVDEVIKKYFDSSVKIKHEDIICFANDGPLFKYDKETGIYSYDGEHEHDGAVGYRTESYIVKSGMDEKTNTYKLALKVLYGPVITGMKGKLDNIYKSAREMNKPIYTVPSEYLDYPDNEIFSIAYDEIDNKVPITTFTFVKDSEGNFGLKSIIIK